MVTTTDSVDGGGRALLRKPRVLLVGLVLALVGASTLAWSQTRRADAEAFLLDAAPLAGTLQGQGRLEAREMAEVGAESAGRIVLVAAEVGDPVEAGALLARIDPDEAELQLESALTGAEAAEAAVVAARAELQGAESQLAQRQDEYARIAPLAGSAVPGADVDAAGAAVERAEAEVVRAAARVEQARAQAEAAAADAATLRRRVDKTAVRSPLGGVVVSRSISLGDLVGAGAPLFRVADPSTLHVWVPFDESVLEELRPGLPAGVRFHSEPVTTYPGRVLRIGREVDPDTREVQVEIALEKAPTQWALGQRADVQVETGAGRATLAVPSSLLSWRDGAPGAYVAVDGRARWVPVSLGRARSQQVEITGGVAAGDTVLAPHAVRDGARVVPVVARSPGAP